MTEPLYTLDILRLAAETDFAPLLAAPDATVERRSPVCGSRITVGVALDESGSVADYGHNVRACALGQASATVLARHVKGRTINELATARDMLVAYLAGADDSLPDWPGIEVLARARPYPARHAAVRLPFEALVDAVMEAQ
ncbi:MAG: iron-sulfur cluster assembly scaffold protein [Sphingomonadales bacterium]